MEPNQPVYTAYIGFDVSKDTVTVHHSGTGIIEDIENNPAGLRRYVRTLDTACLAVCEPTGGHEAALLDALVKYNIPAHRADARKVKAYIRSLGIHGKTDTIDAKALAAYGQERHAGLALWTVPDSAQQELQALVNRRQELVTLQTAEKNRSTAPPVSRKSGRQIKASCKRLLKLLAQEITKAESAIKAIITANQHLLEKHAVLRSVTGIGPAIAAVLLAGMPELGTLSRRQAASLAGVAPHPRQSGKMQGRRRVYGGRQEIKRALFMAALVASRQSTEMKAFYQRLILNGKKPLVALTAIMRKIITILNAKIRDYMLENQVS